MTKHTELARDLSLEDHTDGNAFAMEHCGREDGLDRVADGVPEVDEVAEAGLALVDGDYVRLDADRASDNRQKELLGLGACCFGATCKVGGGRLDGGENLRGSIFEIPEFLLVPDRCGLKLG